MTYAAGISYWEAFLPGLLLVLVAIAVLPWLERDNVRARTAAIAVCLVLTWRYLLWRLFVTLPPPDLSWDFVVGVIFMGVEASAIIGASMSFFFLTRTKSRSAEADRNEIWLRSLPHAPLVDVLICTYNEERPILERTIIGAQAIDYPNYRVWVCDDGRRPWLKEFCRELGCGYLTRPDNAHAKAGNINNALKHLASLAEPPDLISILDADFVAKTQFLTRAVSLMRDEDVGIVQTPQHFFNPDPIQTNLSMARVWPDEQRFFFDVVMASKDAWGGAFCCGTSSVIRFAPLLDIGGFPTDSVTEDYLVSLRMREAGYRTVYLNEALSVGLAPEGLKEYVTQRSRWALGFVQIYRGRSGPLSRRKDMRLIDRIMLTETFLHWSAAHLFRLLALVVPAVYLLFDIQAVYAGATDAISHVFPYFVANMAVMMWMTNGRVLPILADLSQLLCATDIVKSVAMGLFNPRKQKFKVTAKGGDRGKRFLQWPMLRVFLFYLGLTSAGVLWAFTVDQSSPLTASSGMALFWSWYNILILVLACFVCVEASRKRKGERFDTDELVVITVGERSLVLRACDISVTGMRLLGRPPVQPGSKLNVRLGELQAQATLTRVYRDSFAVEFDDVPEVRAGLIRRIYCGAYSAAVNAIRPADVASAIVSRIFR